MIAELEQKIHRLRVKRDALREQVIILTAKIETLTVMAAKVPVLKEKVAELRAQMEIVESAVTALNEVLDDGEAEA